MGRALWFLPLSLGLHTSLNIKEMIIKQQIITLQPLQRSLGPQLSERMEVGEQGGMQDLKGILQRLKI